MNNVISCNYTFRKVKGAKFQSAVSVKIAVSIQLLLFKLKVSVGEEGMIMMISLEKS